MKTETVPYLSGGIFFTLLTEAEGRRPTRREIKNGAKSGITYKNMLEGLIQLFKPSFTQPDFGRTFEGETSEYRSCKESHTENLPFDEEVEITAFDDRVKTDYETVLKDMNDYITSFLDSKSEVRMHWLMKALFTIIENDADMTDDTLFYTSESPITKKELLSLDHYCLSNLLLALWHFIVLNRPDNKLGRATFESINTRTSTMNAKWKFKKEFGTNYYRRFDFNVLAEPNLDEKKGPTEKTAEPEEKEIEDETPRIQEVEAPYKDPLTGKTLMGQFHVEARDHGFAAGIFSGTVIMGNRGDKDD